MLFTGPYAQLSGIPSSVLRAERVHFATGAISPRKFRRYDFASRRAGIRPPTHTAFALRADGNSTVPVDDKFAQIVAAFHLRTMPILLYWANEFDAMSSAALQIQKASNI